MKKMKKWTALLLAAAMCFGLLAGCGGGNNATSSSGTPAPAGTPEGVSSIDPINGWSEYDALIDEIKTTTDFAKRVELMHQAEDLLMSTGAVIPLYYTTDPYMAKDYMSGYYTNPYGGKYFMFTKMSNGSDTLRLNIGSEPDQLDPALNSSVIGGILAVNSFSGLFTYDANGLIVPDMVESYTVSEDGMTYTFKLLPGLKWSNGDKLDANDFVYSWNRLADPSTAAIYSYMTACIARNDDGTLKIAASDDGLTLTVELGYPCAYFLDVTTFTCFYPVHEASVVAADPNGANPGAWVLEAGFVTSGAYTLQTWNHESSMVYVKNPNYHRADEVTVEKLEIMLSSDDAAAYSAYQAGNLDFIDNIPTDEMAQAKQSSEYHCDPLLGGSYVTFSVTSSMFDGKTAEQANAMRLALSLLVDRDYIVENIAQADQTPAAAFIPVGMADGNGGIYQTKEYYDPSWSEENVERARELLEFAGYEFDDDGMLSDTTPLSFEYLVDNGTLNVEVAQALQQDFAEIGISMKIQQEELQSFFVDRYSEDYDLARNGWTSDFNDPINWLEMYTTDSGNNMLGLGHAAGWVRP